jgi:hypothetical protein
MTNNQRSVNHPKSKFKLTQQLYWVLTLVEVQAVDRPDLGIATSEPYNGFVLPGTVLRVTSAQIFTPLGFGEVALITFLSIPHADE